MAIQAPQYLSPGGDLQLAQLDAQRQMKMADILRRSSLEPLQGGMAGRVYVGPSWTQGLGNLLEAWQAGRTENKAYEGLRAAQSSYDTKNRELGQQLVTSLTPQTREDGTIAPIDRNKALAVALQNPESSFSQSIINSHLTSLGPQKIHGQKEVRNNDGTVSIYNVYQDGTMSDTRQKPHEKYQVEDLGGIKRVIDPLAIKPGEEFTKTPAPTAVARFDNTELGIAQKAFQDETGIKPGDLNYYSQFSTWKTAKELEKSKSKETDKWKARRDSLTLTEVENEAFFKAVDEDRVLNPERMTVARQREIARNELSRKERGLPPQNYASDAGVAQATKTAEMGDQNAIKASLLQQEKQVGSMGSFVKNVGKQYERVSEISKELSTFDTRLLNVPYRQLRNKVAGSPLQSKIDMYVEEISSETGKLATGSTGSVAELSTSAREKWEKIHDPNLSMADLMEVLGEAQHAGELRLDSAYEQLTDTRKRRTELLKEGSIMPKEKAAEDKTPVKITSKEEFDALPSGTLFTPPDGSAPRRKP